MTNAAWSWFPIGSSSGDSADAESYLEWTAATYYCQVEDDVDSGTRTYVDCSEPSLLEKASKEYFRGRPARAKAPAGWRSHRASCTPCAYLDVVDVYMGKHAEKFWSEAFSGRLDPLRLEWSPDFEILRRVCGDPDYQADLRRIGRPLLLRPPSAYLLPGPEEPQ